MSFTVLSGINGAVGKEPDGGGAVTALNAIGKWGINPKSEASEFASSATAQASDRVSGNDDWDGDYTAYGDTPAFYPGEYFKMYGFLDDTKCMTGRAIVDDFSLKLDIEGAKEIEHSIKLSCAFDGIAGNELNPNNTTAAHAGGFDVTPMDVQSATGCPIAVCIPKIPFSEQEWYVLKDARSADMSLKTANKNYHSSTTSVKDESVTPNVWRNWCGRVRGNLDATCTIAQYATPDEMIPTKSILGVRLYTQRLVVDLEVVNNPCYLQMDGSVSTTGPGIAVIGKIANGETATCWELDWILFQAHSGIAVDRKAANIIGSSTNGGLKAVVIPYGDSAARMGRIVKPSGLVYWPWTLPRI